jgi:hypothetical protein
LMARSIPPMASRNSPSSIGTTTPGATSPSSAS